MKKSIIFGGVLGIIFGGLVGAGLGAITLTSSGILGGLVIGILLGLLTGALTGASVFKTAGTTEGVSVGVYTGMAVGTFFGGLIGLLIPTSVRLNFNTQGLPVLDALTMGRFETAIFFSFFLAILATLIGGWVAGKNLVPRDIKKK